MQYKEFLNREYDSSTASSAANWAYRQFQKGEDIGLSLEGNKIIVIDSDKFRTALQQKYGAMQVVTHSNTAVSQEKVEAIINEKLLAMQVNQTVTVVTHSETQTLQSEKECITPEMQTKPVAMRAMQSHAMFSALVMISAVMSFTTSLAALQTICSLPFSIASALLFAVTVPYFIFVVRNRDTVRNIAILDMLYLSAVALHEIKSTPDYINTGMQYLVLLGTIVYIYTVIHGISEGASKYL